MQSRDVEGGWATCDYIPYNVGPCRAWKSGSAVVNKKGYWRGEGTHRRFIERRGIWARSIDEPWPRGSS